jgi:hypothetical protein
VIERKKRKEERKKGRAFLIINVPIGVRTTIPQIRTEIVGVSKSHIDGRWKPSTYKHYRIQIGTFFLPIAITKTQTEDKRHNMFQ